MSLRDDLARVVSRDPRYAWQAYLFVLESLEHAKERKKRAGSQAPSARRRRGAAPSNHVTGRQLCEAARALALEQYGQLAPLVLNEWGVGSTSDLGEIVYNLIGAGALEKSPTDSRTDFDDVYDFETAFVRDYEWAFDGPA